MRHDPISAILTNLLARVDGLAGQWGHLSMPRLREEVDQIRHIARAFHLDNVEGLAGTLDSAAALHGPGPILLSYLELLRDAISAEMPDRPSLSIVPRADAATATVLHA